MPLVSTVAGAYTNTYTPGAANGASDAGASATTMGVMDDNGFELSWTPHSEEVRGTDVYGGMLLDGLTRGSDFKLRFRVMNYNLSAMSAAYPYGKKATSTLFFYPIAGVIARRWSDIEGIIVLTVTASTPANLGTPLPGPATLTASHSILSPNANPSLLFTSKIRTVPIEMVLLPYTVSAETVWFVAT